MLLASCAMLGACGGGGGGGVVSTPAPTPTPTPAPTPTPTPTPTPANSDIADLQVSQAFAASATTTDVSLSTSDGFVQATGDTRATLQISYDASDGSYTVSVAGRSETFLASDELLQRWGGERRFAKAGGGDYLTLVTNPYFGAEFSNKYVGMGYWQSNALSGGIQQTYFTTFTYGFETSGSSTPRTGAGHWLIDIFGLLTIPDKELRIVQGLGDFEVDFADGTFVSSAYLVESNVVTDGGTGGSLRFDAGGHLDSTSGFSGLFSYSGIDTSLQGTLTGGFYGPNANEIGATFNASGGGASLTGAMTGQQFPVGSTSDGIRNISLTNVLVDQRLFGQTVTQQWTVVDGEAGFSSLVGNRTVGIVDMNESGEFEGISLAFNQGYMLQPTEIDASGPANFTTYRSTLNGNPLTLSVYRVGSANDEVALTYSGFATWQSSEDGAIPSGQTTETFHRQFMTFGLPTVRELMVGRTGSAEYAGVVYGSGANMRGDTYDIGGTSHFAVDFSAATYNGWLQLTGTAAAGGVADFGQWTFASNLPYGALVSAPLVGPGSYFPSSEIFPTFYGPTGQEIGAIFSLGIGWPENEDSIHVIGVTVAKEQ